MVNNYQQLTKIITMIILGQKLPTIIDNFKAALFVRGLLGAETGGEGCFIGGRDEDAAAGVFGAGAAVDADGGATGDLTNGGEKASELGGAGDGDRID